MQPHTRHIKLPPDIARRLKEVARKLSTIESHFMQDAIRERVEQFEARFEREEEKREQRRRDRFMPKNKPAWNEAPPMPADLNLLTSTAPSTSAHVPDQMLIERYCTLVLAADTEEERINRAERIAESITLTATSEAAARDLIARLDARIKEMQADPLFGAELPDND